MATTPIPFGQGLQPFFNLPAHIKPPPGWPFIVLPAEPGNTASETISVTNKIARTKLAANVVCMWPEARPKVENIRWRGKYPRIVTRMQSWIDAHTIREGVFCVVRYPYANHGRIVYVYGRAHDGDWKVRTIGEPLTVFGPVDMTKEWKDMKMEIGEHGLCRCPQPSDWGAYLR